MCKFVGSCFLQVLLKLLGKTSINVETVLDGVECTDKVFSMDHGYYSIILVSIVEEVPFIL